MNKITIIYLALVIIPTVPLLLAWLQVLILHDPRLLFRDLTIKVPLFVTTASCLQFLSGLLFPLVIGPAYSARRFTTIWVNLGLNLLMIVISLRGKNRFKLLTAIASGAAALAWLYAWVVSAAV